MKESVNDKLSIAIIYFSATGGCRQIAGDIAAFVLPYSKKTDTKDITYCLKTRLGLKYDLVFVLFPVYNQRLTNEFKRFLRLQIFGGI